jgi:hypothetical protein
MDSFERYNHGDATKRGTGVEDASAVADTATANDTGRYIFAARFSSDAKSAAICTACDKSCFVQSSGLSGLCKMDQSLGKFSVRNVEGGFVVVAGPAGLNTIPRRIVFHRGNVMQDGQSDGCR